MAKSVFDYKNYKLFIIDWIDKHSDQKKGLRKSLAEAIGCQTPYITHVLTGEYHFSPEQAEACARWLGLSINESEYFFLLVLRQRAGTQSLIKMLERQIEEKLTEENGLKKRLKIREGLTPE